MPTLNEIMCIRTVLCIVRPGVSGMQTVTNGMCDGQRFDFDFVSSDFQVPPVHFHPRRMDASEAQRRDASIALFQSWPLLEALASISFTLHVEQDALILDGGTLHDLRKGRDSMNSPDRTRTPTEAPPAGRQVVGYFHTHPDAAVMRPPTPSADWNPVPGVGIPGVGTALHFMIESNRRAWGLLANRRAFIVGAVRATRLYTVDPGSDGFDHCWELS
ncbi:MAG: hypothetical protein DYH06_06010 [Acidobacteria bacterium ACB2]|nr:hypothetical protein [Acidobacteria bacterium ACB2]